MFRIFENDMEIDSIQTSCLSDGDDINSDEYYIGREYSSNIQIEIWYEGWDDINLYLGEGLSNIGIIDLGKIGKEFKFKLNKFCKSSQIFFEKQINFNSKVNDL